MTNQVHLLVSAERKDGVCALMKALGQRYVQYVNRTYRRSSTLWEAPCVRVVVAWIGIEPWGR